MGVRPGTGHEHFLVWHDSSLPRVEGGMTAAMGGDQVPHDLPPPMALRRRTSKRSFRDRWLP
eukprot:scaffold299494_cov28-Attheya_sp.AAC.1